MQVRKYLVRFCVGAYLGLLAACASISATRSTVDKLTYHGDAMRSGWNSAEKALSPQAVASSDFGLLWQSPAFDSAGTTPPRMFAVPLYVHAVAISAAEFAGRKFAVVYAATTTGFIYAVSAKRSGATLPGTILWKVRLSEQPCTHGSFGVLSTPVIDLKLQRLYVAACDSTTLWSVHALDIRSGQAIGGWPVRIDPAKINVAEFNRNGPNKFPEGLSNLQRGALNLSPDRTRLYVAFGAEPVSGWVIAVDTVSASLASAFSATAATAEGVGGMWASGGAAVDAQGRIYLATGSSIVNMLAGKGVAGVYPDSAHNWGQSIISLTDGANGLALRGTYTPFNYCQVGARDMDLGSSSPVLFDLDPSQTSTPHLLALGGGKQGNAYLLDRDHLPGSLAQRQGCSDDASTDKSLLAPQAQPQFGKPGPLNVFGPYTEKYGMGDQARSRSVLAHFRDGAGSHYLFLTGSSKVAEDSPVSVAPSLVRLRVVTTPGRAAYLRHDQDQPSLVFLNPGSPVISSNGAADAIVWVLDANKPRSASLYGADVPTPVLYAVDAMSMKLLWKSKPGELQMSGKYNEPTIAEGQVLVGTDRIQAFGLRSGSQHAKH